MTRSCEAYFPNSPATDPERYTKKLINERDKEGKRPKHCRDGKGRRRRSGMEGSTEIKIPLPLLKLQ